MNKKTKIIIPVIIALSIIAMFIFVSYDKNAKLDTVPLADVSILEKTNEIKTEAETENKTKSVPPPEISREMISEVVKTIEQKNDGDTDSKVMEITKINQTNNQTEVIKTIAINPGTSLVNIETGQVVTKEGNDVVTNVEAGSQQAPQQSFVLDLEETVIPAAAIKLSVKQDGFTPNEFTVVPGQLVSLFVSNVNDSASYEIFRFDNPDLEAIAVSLRAGQTKSISFNAPSEPGEYIFYSAQLNHRELGAVGKMIVK